MRYAVGPAVTIASGQTTSSYVDRKGNDIVGWLIPAAFTGTAVSFTGCDTAGGTYSALQFEGSLVLWNTAAGRVIMCHPSKFWGFEFWKIVSNAAEGAARTIYPLLRRFEEH